MNFIDRGGPRIWTRVGTGNCGKTIKVEHHHQLARSVTEIFFMTPYLKLDVTMLGFPEREHI